MDGLNVLAGANVGPQSGRVVERRSGAGDFNGDGKADILWQNDDGTPAIWLMDGFNVVIRRQCRAVQSRPDVARDPAAPRTAGVAVA